MAEKRSYYAIIPANVRYDKELTANAKLLYGEITALCNEKGYCWASNQYFAELYGVSVVSISKWISQLVKCGYINSVLAYKEGTKEIDKRYLTLVNDPIKEKFKGSETKVNDPIKEKFKDNNTFNNTTNNTLNNSISGKPDPIPYREIIDYLNSKTDSNYKSTSKRNQSLIKARYSEGFTLEDFKTVIDKKVAEWANDNKMSAYLRPETLFGTKFEGYLNQRSNAQVFEFSNNDYVKNEPIPQEEAEELLARFGKWKK